MRLRDRRLDPEPEPAPRSEVCWRRAAALCLAVLSGAPAARSQDVQNAQDVQDVNAVLEDVGIAQRLGAQIPLDLEFRDSTGRAVRLERPQAHELVPAVVAAAPGLVDSVAVAKPTLEDVFLRLTGRRLSSEL